MDAGRVLELALLDSFDVSGDASLVVPAEYLEAVIIKRTPEVLHECEPACRASRLPGLHGPQ